MPALKAWQEAVGSADFLLAIGYGIIAVTITQLVPQRKRDAPVYREESFFVRSPLLDNDYKPSEEQIVPASALVAICICVPLGIQLLLSAFDAPRHRFAVAARLYAYVYATASTICVVDVLKVYVGYWRPYFYDECDFNLTTGKCDSGSDDDAFRSFPSGHSALSMVTLGHSTLCCLSAARPGLPSLVNIGQLRRPLDVGPLKLIVCLAPAALAVWIAATRLVDNDHWPADIVAGAAIGATFSALFHFRYFPCIFNPDSNAPRPVFLGCESPDAQSHREADQLPAPSSHVSQSASVVGLSPATC